MQTTTDTHTIQRDIHYNPNLDRLTNQAFMWDCLYSAAKGIVRSYTSDFCHDALWLAQECHQPRARTFYYGIGSTGTTIYEQEADALSCRQYDRGTVYKCTLAPGGVYAQVWVFTMECIVQAA